MFDIFIVGQNTVLFFLEMELFKHETLKRKWKVFTTKTMLDIIDCNYCSKTSCINDYYFNMICLKCRNETCSYCCVFNQEFNFLLENASEEARNFIFDYVRDFYGISNSTLNFFYKNNKKIKDLNHLRIVLKLQKFSSIFRIENLIKAMVYTSYINRKKKTI